jgi:hypothetical protein
MKMAQRHPIASIFVLVLPNSPCLSLVFFSLQGKCMLMMVSHDALVAMQHMEKQQFIKTWRDGLRYFHNEFEYGVKNEM